MNCKDLVILSKIFAKKTFLLLHDLFLNQSLNSPLNLCVQKETEMVFIGILQ